MPNLYDVIELSPITKDKPVVKPLLTKVNKHLADLGPLISKSTMDSLTDDINASLSAQREALFNENLSLPSDLLRSRRLYHKQGVIHDYEDSTDARTKLAQSRKTTLAHLKRTADMLNMIIMPFDALNPKSVSSTSYGRQSSIHSFTGWAATANLDCYVVAPLSLYSVQSHVQSKTPGWLYSSVHDSILTTMSLQLPMFRSLSAAVTSLESRVSELESFRTTMTNQMADITSRLTDLEHRVAEETRKRAEEKAAEQVRLAAAAERSLDETWIVMDPLLFAVPNGGKSDDTIAVVGPAWGPDFSDALLEISGLSVIPGQRKALQEIY